MNSKGMTLNELMVTTAILVIVGTAISVSGLRAIDAAKVTGEKTRIITDAQNTLARLANKLRSSHYDTVSVYPCKADDNCSGDRIVFKTAIKKPNAEKKARLVPIVSLTLAWSSLPTYNVTCRIVLARTPKSRIPM